jgi:hypothetical protein
MANKKDRINVEVTIPRVRVIVNGHYFDPSKVELSPELKEKVARALELFEEELLAMSVVKELLRQRS